MAPTDGRVARPKRRLGWHTQAHNPL